MLEKSRTVFNLQFLKYFETTIIKENDRNYLSDAFSRRHRHECLTFQGTWLSLTKAMLLGMLAGKALFWFGGHQGVHPWLYSLALTVPYAAQVWPKFAHI